MKKVILSVMIAGTLLATGCKKAKDLKDASVETVEKAGDAVAEGAKDVAAAAGDVVESAIEGVSIPKFEDPKVGEHLKAYSEYAKEYIAAGKDAYKNGDLMKKGKDLLAKGKEILASLDGESAEKFKAVVTAIQSKMAPAN